MCTITTKTTLLKLQKKINNAHGFIRRNPAFQQNFKDTSSMYKKNYPHYKY